jgi:hypothetical protein
MSDEVFIMTINEDLDDTTTEIFIYQSLEACNFGLGEASWGNLDEDNIRVYHGILTDATFIPEDFKGCTPYITLKNPEGLHIIALEEIMMNDGVDFYLINFSKLGRCIPLAKLPAPIKATLILSVFNLN